MREMLQREDICIEREAGTGYLQHLNLRIAHALTCLGVACCLSLSCNIDETDAIDSFYQSSCMTNEDEPVRAHETAYIDICLLCCLMSLAQGFFNCSSTRGGGGGGGAHCS